jgi:polysaccharide chain length determinant protein (PEP-CTERM system associated)
MEISDGINPAEFLRIWKRRKWSLLITAAVLFGISAVIAFVLPAVYRSTSTILIEDQEIPPELVMTTVTSYAEQRLQMLNQRIMSTPKLLENINRFHLYSDLKARKTTEEIVAKMRKDIKMETISADVVDRRTGSPKQATIAFTLSYSGKDPNVTQQIANVLASLYLEENIKVREQQTTGATKFLEEEMKKVQANLRSIDARISDYKERNISVLPELVSMNLSEQAQTETALMQLNEQVKTLRERESTIREQLGKMTEADVNPDKVRLNEMRAKLAELQTRYSDQYPDVKKLKVSIPKLQEQLETQDDTTSASRLQNPQYAMFSAQLAGTKSEIESARRQIEVLKEKRDVLRRNFAEMPRVEEGFKALMSERISLQGKNDDLSRKYLEAKVAHGLEKEQLGERFTIIDPARMPEKPVSPNRPAILLIGLILGLGAGVGLVALRENGDQSVRDTETLSKATGVPVLAGIPEIVTASEIDTRRSRKRFLVAGGMAALIVGLFIIHFLVMDLDVVWAKLVRRLNA